MYTGIIKDLAEVEQVQNSPGLTRLGVRLPQSLVEGLERGASVAIDGVCLTALEQEGNLVYFQAMGETLQRTTLGQVKVGGRVNVERSSRSGAEVGGHTVSGHVDGVVEIVGIDKPEGNHVVTFRAPRPLMKYIFSKGFVALDGASLTVVDSNAVDGTFKVWFIPETLRLTTFGFKVQGDIVNLEVENNTRVLVDTSERLEHARTSSAVRESLTKDLLKAPTFGLAIVIGAFHRTEANTMLEEARTAARELGLIIYHEIWVPGSLEKPLALKRVLLRPEVNAAVVLGIIERGQTKHGLVMGQAVVQSIINLELELMKPVGMGILGPEILPEQIPSRTRPYARAAVVAAGSMLGLDTGQTPTDAGK